MFRKEKFVELVFKCQLMLMRYVDVCSVVCYYCIDVYDCDVCVFVLLICNADKYNVDVDECDEYDKQK